MDGLIEYAFPAGEESDDSDEEWDVGRNLEKPLPPTAVKRELICFYMKPCQLIRASVWANKIANAVCLISPTTVSLPLDHKLNLITLLLTLSILYIHLRASSFLFKLDEKNKNNYCQLSTYI